jgi:hypothetical protein
MGAILLRRAFFYRTDEHEITALRTRPTGAVRWVSHAMFGGTA